MLGDFTKRINEKTPYQIKLLMSKLIRRQLINNANFRECYDLLVKKESMSSNEIQEIQGNQLRKLLEYVNKYSVYYHNIIKKYKIDIEAINIFEEVKKFPILTKKDLIKNYKEILSSENLNTYVATTGGTTGVPLKVILDFNSIYSEKAFIYKTWEDLDYDIHTSKTITFRGVDVGGKIFKYNPLYNEMILSPFYLNNQSIEDYMSIINKFKPEFIHGYPSAIKNFCRILKENNINLQKPIKGVFFISEEVSVKDTEFIEEVLGCKSLAFYGHTERCAFGTEVRQGIYQFDPFYGYTELIKTDFDGEYNIVSTGFLNRKLPLIRYDTNDVGILDEEGIIIKGRSTNQHLYGKNGEIISLASKVFHDSIFNKIVRYQFVQNEVGKVKLLFLDKVHDNKINDLDEYLNQTFENVIEFDIEQVEVLELTSRGKEILLIQRVNS